MFEGMDTYKTTGIPYYVRMVQGYQTLVGLEEIDYRMMLSKGFQDEEVYLSFKKQTNPGPDYEFEVRAGLNTIKIDGVPRFQLALDAEQTQELKDRGYEDGRPVDLLVKKSPYRIPSRQIRPEDVALDIFDESDPMLDAPEVWLQPE